MKNKNNPITVIVFIIFELYSTSIPIMAIYFNYQYARDNEFWDWVFFGFIKPTLKATVWPFFI